MKKKSDKPSRWRLRPIDLPPERLRAGEPRLGDLENNPVFRYIIWRRRGLKDPYGIVQSAFILLVWAYLIFPGAMPSLNWTMAPIIWAFVIFQLARNFGGSRNRRDNRTFGFHVIPGQFMADLCQAGVPPETFIQGFWGATLSRGRLVRDALLPAAALTAGGALLLRPDIVPERSRMIVLIGFAAFTALLTAYIRPVYFALSLQRAIVNNKWRAMQLRRRPIAGLLRFLLRVFGLVLVMLVVFGGLAFYTPRRHDLPVGAALASVLGVLMGFWLNARAHRLAEKNYAQMAQRTEEILEWIAQRREEGEAGES